MVKNLFLLSSSQKPKKPSGCEKGLGWVISLQAVASVDEETPQQDGKWWTEIRNGLLGKAREDTDNLAAAPSHWGSESLPHSSLTLSGGTAPMAPSS